jgi:hypothetical protein
MYKQVIESPVEMYDYQKTLEESGYHKKDIDAVRRELDIYPEIPKFILNEQILAFYICQHGKIDETVKKFRSYYKSKREAPEFFSDRDPESKEITHCLNHQYYVSLPVTPDNCNLIFFCLKDNDPKNYNYDSALKTYIMLTECYMFQNGPRPDSIFLCDMKGASFRHALRVSLSSIRKGMHFLQNSSPLNVKAFHVLNAMPFIAYLLSLVKPFVTTGILSKVHFHTSDIDWNEFYEKHIPRSHLPKEYGGDLDTIEKLHENDREKLLHMKNYFLYEERQVNFEFDEYAEQMKANCNYKG